MQKSKKENQLQSTTTGGVFPRLCDQQCLLITG